MAENKNFSSNVNALFEGMSGFVATKTVIGDAVHIGDTIILPLVDVSFGMGAGSNGGGMGGKMTPSAVLVINNGSSKVVNIKNQDSLSKILDMVPDIVNKLLKKDGKENSDTKLSDEEIIEAATNQNN